MIVFPNCKINLGLQVLRKRSDGFHDISTLFYPVPLADSLEVITYKSISEPIVFTSSGLSTGTDINDNLCIKAFQLLKNEYPNLPPLRMHLHKVIPMGAGLGGGSSDAAFTLKLLNLKYQLDIPVEKLEAFALQLGSDCPFFIENKACYATGRGEDMEPAEIDLAKYSLVLVYPGIHISTPWAFNNITPAGKTADLRQIVSQPVEYWKDELFNDFENPVFKMYPQIAEIKQTLYNQGAIYSAMSGSGSVVYGIFKQKPSLEGVFDDSFRVFIF